MTRRPAPDWVIYPPTKRQLQVLALIEAHIRKHRCSPTYRELAEKLDIAIGPVAEHVTQLELRGLIKRDRGVARGIRVVKKQPVKAK